MKAPPPLLTWIMTGDLALRAASKTALMEEELCLVNREQKEIRGSEQVLERPADRLQGAIHVEQTFTHQQQETPQFRLASIPLSVPTTARRFLYDRN